MTSPVVTIVGATATGKSALGLALAETLDGEIVNADALQVYRGFDVGTAKPSADELRRVPHHLIDVLEPHERYSAGEFARRATAAIGEIQGRGRVAILVGGSGLYLRALLAGISPVPPGDPELRERLRRRLVEEGLPSLVAELARRDPETVARLAPGDTQRVLRALEVVHASGRPLSAWIASQPFGVKRLPAIQLGLTVPRAILYDRIAGRVARMVAEGWIEEVASLLAAGFAPDLPAFQAIGYREIARYLARQSTREAAIEETIRATRRFAKRQETWFRKEREVAWFDGRFVNNEGIAEVLAHLVASGLGRGDA